MSVYLVSICEITNFSESLSESADVSAAIEENGALCWRGPINKVVEGSLLDENGYHKKFPNKE